MLIDNIITCIPNTHLRLPGGATGYAVHADAQSAAVEDRKDAPGNLSRESPAEFHLTLSATHPSESGRGE